MASQAGSGGDFDIRIDDKIKFVGLIGPPGAGKCTQCTLLKRDLQFQHLRIGALMREESNRPDNIKAQPEGALYSIAPHKYPCRIAIGYSPVCIGGLEGFPRDLEQRDYFGSKSNALSLLILLECPEQVYIERLLSRGRFDDNAESIEGRLDTYQVSTVKVIAAYESSGILERVN